MMKVAKRKEFSIFATAISDAATANLAKLSKNTPGLDMQIYNFASMYGLVPQYDKDGYITGYDFPSERSIAQNNLPKIVNSKKVILIFDEASMVSTDTLNKIKKLTPDITILYIGDTAQIMPMGDTDISKIFEYEDQYKLTEVMRQGKESPILNTANSVSKEIHNFDLTKKLKLSPIQDLIYTKYDSNNNSGTIVTNLEETFINEAVADFKRYEAKNTVVITGNNDNVSKLNKQIREKIVKSDDRFIVGERLMTYSKYSKYNGKGRSKTEIYNSSVIDILSVVKSDIDGVPTNLLSVTYIDQEGNLQKTDMNVIHREDKEDVNRFFANKAKLSAEYKRTNNISILQVLEKYNKTVTVDYAYAMTAHKVQGQTVRNSYVLPVYRGFSDIESRRMFYTSITRPTDKLVTLNNSIPNNHPSLENRSNYTEYSKIVTSQSKISEKEFNNQPIEVQQAIIEQAKKDCKTK